MCRIAQKHVLLLHRVIMASRRVVEAIEATAAFYVQQTARRMTPTAISAASAWRTATRNHDRGTGTGGGARRGNAAFLGFGTAAAAIGGAGAVAEAGGNSSMGDGVEWRNRRNSSDGKYYSGAWSRKVPREGSGDDVTERGSEDGEEKFFDADYEYLMV